MANCDVDILCKLGLYEKTDINKWIAANHPDRNKNVDPALFANVLDCLKAKQVCPKENKNINTKKKVSVFHRERARIYSCMRQSENWSKISPVHKLDSKLFDKTTILSDLPITSPKMIQMLNIIKRVDEADIRTYGRMFKHYIFSDVKEGGYGAKIIASAFIANGFNMAVENYSSTPARGSGNKSVKRLRLKKPSGVNTFGILSSTPLWKSELNQRFKKEMLSVYNSRPRNINGKDMRFIILDSGFKEGIDLFDVKYVHIFENPASLADTKQIIGRATRTCGQKGLDFEPNIGWPLFVYNYSLLIPEDIKHGYIASDPELLHNGIDDAMIYNHNALSDSAMLYGEADNSLSNFTNQLYALASAFSVDYVLTKNIHKSYDDLEYTYKDSNKSSPSSASGATGGAKSKVIHCLNSKCGKRSTNDVPLTQQIMRQVYIKNGYPVKNIPAKNPRSFFCNFMKTTPSYCGQLNETLAERASMVPALVVSPNTPPKNTPYPLPTFSSPSINTPIDSIKYNSPPIPTNGYMSVSPSTDTTQGNSNTNGYMSVSPSIDTTQGNSNTNGYMLLRPSTEPINSNSSPLYASNMNIPMSTYSQAPEYVRQPPISSPSNRSDINRSIKTLQYEISELKKELSPKSNKNNSPPDFDRKNKLIRDFRSDLATLRKELVTLRKELESDPMAPISSNISQSHSQSQSQSQSLGSTSSRIMESLDLVPYSPPRIENAEVLDYTGNNDIALRIPEPGPPLKKIGFLKMRDFIQTNFAVKFTWPPILVENRCGTVARQSGGANIMKLNPSQNFIKSFFTTSSPYKGILLWHSVGTGKTCTAIAAASSSFEKDGYTILWVTRNTLKGDVKKNIYDDICHQILAEKLARGIIKSIPEDTTKRNKLLGNNWIEPISFKTFSNLLSQDKHNEYMEMLKKRNGTVDILNKTLIIIDEAHKLYGGDLKGSEKPDMDVMEKMLQNSYIKSGKNSARLILMTATPITTSPMELFKLVNLCVDNVSERIPTDIVEFKPQFLNNENKLSKDGTKKLADRLTGYISYLNRENDPTQFAQPIIIHVPAIMSTILGDTRSNVDDNDKTQEQDIKERSKLAKIKIKELTSKLSETKKINKGRLDELVTKCKTLKTKKERDECIKRSKDSIAAEFSASTADINIQKEQLNELLASNKAKISEFSGTRKKNKDDKKNRVPNQEIAIMDRCGHIKPMIQ